MISLFKMWAAENIQETWNQDLENYIFIRKPQTHAELESTIAEYEERLAKKKAKSSGIR